MGQTDNSEADTTLRPFEAVDIPVLVDLWVASWRATLPTIDFEARRGWIAAALANPAWRILVAETRGALSGFAAREDTILHQLVVALDARGKGVARCLLDAVKTEVPGVLRLEVNQDNPRAVRFYQREGFRQRGAAMNPTSGLATWIMEWVRGSSAP